MVAWRPRNAEKIASPTCHTRLVPNTQCLAWRPSSLSDPSPSFTPFGLPASWLTASSIFLLIYLIYLMNPHFSYFLRFALVDNAEVNVFPHVYWQTSASIPVEYTWKREVSGQSICEFVFCLYVLFLFYFVFLRATNIYYLSFWRTGIWGCI